LAAPIEVGEWTTVELTVQNEDTCLEAVLCFQIAHLPGDVDGNGSVDMSDATRFGDLFPHGTVMLGDLNGDGQMNLNDVTKFGQIWQGTGGEGKNPDGTGGWQGQGLPPRPACTCP